MTPRLVDELYPVEQRIPGTEWDAFEDNYYQQLGFSGTLSPHLNVSLQHPVGGSSPNRLHFLPDDTISRIRSATKLSSELTTIIDETHDCAVSATDRDIIDPGMVDRYVESLRGSIDTVPADETAIEKVLLCSRIVSHLQGDVEYESLEEGADESDEPKRDFPGEIDIIVVAHNDRNFEDIELYSIEDTDAFFGSAQGDTTRMFDRLRASDRQPTTVIKNLAFDTEGESWGQSSAAPETPISYVTTDQKGRKEFSRIDQPGAFFESSWGDLSEMVDLLNEHGTGDGVEYLCGCGRPWRISAGIRY